MFKMFNDLMLIIETFPAVIDFFAAGNNCKCFSSNLTTLAANNFPHSQMDKTVTG